VSCSTEELLTRVGANFEKKRESAGVCLYMADIYQIFRRFGEPVAVVSIEPSVWRSLHAESLADGLADLRPFGLSESKLAIIVVPTEKLEAVSVSRPEVWSIVDSRACESVRASRRPRVALSRAIGLQVPLTSLSPYNTAYATSPRMFFGRKEEVGDILRRPHQSVAIVGPRRVGKTSLVKELARRLRAAAPERAAKGGDERYLHSVAEADCNLLSGDVDWGEELFDTLGRSIGLEAKDQIYRHRVLGLRLGEHGAFGFLAKLVTSKYRSITIIIDEIDALLEKDRSNNWSVLRKLQGLVDAQARDLSRAEGSQTKVVLVGFALLDKTLYDYSFPFFGRCHRVVMGNLDRESVAKLVLEPLSELGITVEREDEVINKIVGETGGMPSIVQALCREAVLRLEASGDRRVTPDLVGLIVKSQAPLTDYLRWLDYNTGTLEKVMVYYSAPSGAFGRDEFLSFLKTKKIGRVGPDDLRPVLDRLALANVFREIRQHESYEFSVEAFRNSMAQRVRNSKPLDVLLRALRSSK